MDKVHRVLSTLKNGKSVTYPFMGVHAGQQVRNSSKTPVQLSVLSVLPDSPAAKAGLKSGDTIVSINGKSVTGISSLQDAVQKGTPGDTVGLELRSGGHGRRSSGAKETKVNVKLGDFSGYSKQRQKAAQSGAPAQIILF